MLTMYLLGQHSHSAMRHPTGPSRTTAFHFQGTTNFNQTINIQKHCRLLPCRAVPDYKIARKSIDDAVASGSRFPWQDGFELSRDLIVDATTVIETLSPLMTPERIARIEAVCAARTFDVLPIIESPYDWGNVAAVCRSADALGCGAVHVIRAETEERYKQSSRTSGGSDKWLDVQLHNSTTECISHAKRRGFQIVVAHVGNDAVSPDAIDWTRPTAILFGNELSGVSPEALALADVRVVLPIDGFVESYNISVAASLLLWEARRLRSAFLTVPQEGNNSAGHGTLTKEEQHILKALFFLRNKGMAKQYASNLLRRPPPEWQVDRNKGNWGGKSFEKGVSTEGTMRRKRCYYWDGHVCYGEKTLFPGKKCLYHESHIEGISTLNKVKLGQQCAKFGIEVPDVNAARLAVRAQEAVGGRSGGGAEDEDKDRVKEGVVAL